MFNNNDYQSNISVFSFHNAIPCLGDCEFFFRKMCNHSDNKIIVSIVQYLEYQELISLKHTSKFLYKKIDKKVIKSYIRKGGISDKTRKDFWISNIEYKEMEQLIKKELFYSENAEQVYQKILDKSDIEKKQADKVFFRVTEEINRDIGRTFHTGKFSSEEGQMELGRVLRALAFVRPEIGYCQGMNFIAGALIQFMDEEDTVFWIFLSLLDLKELNSLYFKNMPDYSIRIYQLNYYIKQFLPDLFYHFKKHQINPDIFFSKWILTIFSSYLSFEILAKIWDIFLIDKWKAIFKFCIVFLSEIYDVIITMDLNTLSKYFRENSKRLHTNINKLLDKYSKFKITNRELQELRENFFIDQIKKKLEDQNYRWDTDQSEAVGLFKSDLETYDKEMKSKISFIQDKLQTLDKEFQVSYDSYLNQIKLCSTIKNKIEELIESKTAYENVISILKKEINTIKLMNENKRIGESQEKVKSKNSKNIVPPPNSSRYNNKLSANQKSNIKYFPDPYINQNNFNSKMSPEEEIMKISKKLKKVNKEIEKFNKNMLRNYKLLDEKKYITERNKDEKEKYKVLLERTLLDYEGKIKGLLKNLIDKLRLSEKFVKTSQF